MPDRFNQCQPGPWQEVRPFQNPSEPNMNRAPSNIRLPRSVYLMKETIALIEIELCAKGSSMTRSTSCIPNHNVISAAWSLIVSLPMRGSGHLFVESTTVGTASVGVVAVVLRLKWKTAAPAIVVDLPRVRDFPKAWLGWTDLSILSEPPL